MEYAKGLTTRPDAVMGDAYDDFSLRFASIEISV